MARPRRAIRSTSTWTSRSAAKGSASGEPSSGSRACTEPGSTAPFVPTASRSMAASSIRSARTTSSSTPTSAGGCAGRSDNSSRSATPGRATGPTAVNLFWALDRMRSTLLAGRAMSVDAIRSRLLAEAQAILDEDVAANRAMGDHGATLVPSGARILTHCNAGALATAGYGTALGVVRSAHAQGKVALVWVDETRPVMQGSRLTAWECVRDGIPHRLVADVVAASL